MRYRSIAKHRKGTGVDFWPVPRSGTFWQDSGSLYMDEENEGFGGFHLCFGLVRLRDHVEG